MYLGKNVEVKGTGSWMAPKEASSIKENLKRNWGFECHQLGTHARDDLESLTPRFNSIRLPKTKL